MALPWSIGQVNGRKVFLILSLTCLFAESLLSAPPIRQGLNGQTPSGLSNSGARSFDALQETKDTVSNLRYQVSNHEQEIREFDEKLKNLDSIIESLRDQLNTASKVQKEQLKESAEASQEKITALDSGQKGVVADLRQFKTHANETAAALAQYKQKLVDLEKVIEQQNQNIAHLQAAMRSLMEALGKGGGGTSSTASSISSASSGNTYCVKPGDSLEKIARLHQTTTQVLKDLNGLKSDKIVVGKELFLPEKTP